MTLNPTSHVHEAKDVLSRLMAAFEQREQTSAARLATYPPIKPCPTCGNPAEIDKNSLWDGDTGAPLEPNYRCGPCSDRAAHRRQITHLQRLQITAGIPSDVRHATLANFSVNCSNVRTDPGYSTPAQFLAATQAFLSRDIRNLFLAGSVGIGKGHLAAAVANHYFGFGFSNIIWTEVSQLFRDYHGAYKDSSTERLVAPLKSALLLVLDEICLRDLPADGEEILFSVIDARHKKGRPTILLGNQPALHTAKWLGERVTDRLKSGGHQFHFGQWDSMRGNAADGATALSNPNPSFSL
jgi:DNA replication protein DnaC